MSYLIAVDWGISSFRAYCIDDTGKVLQKIDADEGILSVEGVYEETLETQLKKISGLSPATPVIAAGMITSRQGWCETPYVQCPAGAEDLAESLVSLESARVGEIWFVPGVNQLLPEPDIMRGEESQLAGVGNSGDVVAILPGTHSKWAEVKNQKIVRFKTFMTGELFAIVIKHSILRSLSAEVWSDELFKKGVRQGFSFGRDGNGLLSGLFQVRVQVLLGREQEAGNSSHVSGLLIGCEIGEAVGCGFNRIESKLIVGTAGLSRIYHMALLECGIKAEVAENDASAHGLYRIARYKGLI